ncbi:hypothetical protein VSR01_20985 [Actinacidiphila sp. DG2A-62]|uniref:hypothetical protein n=1 Tax=Actinacidiphila sp. DG2A-62 TaxID=3108821 RepID=UPI002DB91310|nr:hypothetical protein [Actinacidiphila sp. DG2A-62]MEC3995857.1 hypothetical protein [Actinacidiphila sp. DG2A-62]
MAIELITPAAIAPPDAWEVCASWKWSAAESTKVLPEPSKNTQGLSEAPAKVLNWNRPKQSLWLNWWARSGYPVKVGNGEELAAAVT